MNEHSNTRLALLGAITDPDGGFRDLIGKRLPGYIFASVSDGTLIELQDHPLVIVFFADQQVNGEVLEIDEDVTIEVTAWDNHAGRLIERDVRLCV